MKKSEAIQIIADWMSGERHGTGITTKYTLQSAQELLDLIQHELGMKPPEVIDNGYVIMLDEWEQEEKKLMPTPLTEEELADVYANNEDLQKPE